MDYNKFIGQYSVRYCVHYIFADYRTLKSRAKGRSLAEKGTGKIIPSPNTIVRAIAKKISGDTAVKSENGGYVQRLMFADKAQFLSCVGKMHRPNIKNGNGAPCSFHVEIEVTASMQLASAKELGLI